MAREEAFEFIRDIANTVTSFAVEVLIDGGLVYLTIHNAQKGNVFYSCLWGVAALYIIGRTLAERVFGVTYE